MRSLPDKLSGKLKRRRSGTGPLNLAPSLVIVKRVTIRQVSPETRTASLAFTSLPDEGSKSLRQRIATPNPTLTLHMLRRSDAENGLQKRYETSPNDPVSRFSVSEFPSCPPFLRCIISERALLFCSLFFRALFSPCCFGRRAPLFPLRWRISCPASCLRFFFRPLGRAG